MNKPVQGIMILVLLVFHLFVNGQMFVSDTNFSGVVGSGARAFGMGGAFIAVADDATAASWNPGGLGQLERPELSFVIRNQNYRRIEPAFSTPLEFIGPMDINGSTYGFDFLSFTYPLRIGNLKIVPQVSYQRSINYTLDTQMNNVTNNRIETLTDQQILAEFQGAFTQSDKFTGGIDTISFSIGSRLWNRINVGFSANIWTNGFKGEETSTATGEIIRLDDSSFLGNFLLTDYTFISVDIKAFNFYVGVLVDVLENLKIGAVYKSSATADINYEADARSERVSSVFGSVAVDYRESDTSTMKWPETWGFGISYRPIDVLTLSLDFTETQWSQSILKDFKHRGTEFGEVVEEDLYFPSFFPVNNPYDFKQRDTQQLRFGLEYILIGKKTFIPLRFGAFTDTQYFSDAAGEIVKFVGLTAGLGIKKGGLAIDLAVLYETGKFLNSNYDFTVTQFTDLRIYASTIYSF